MKKKIGLVSLSAVLALSALTPAVAAANVSNQVNNEERVQIQIASKEFVVTKNELIARVKELFPGKFDYLHLNDFHMNSGHRYQEDEEGVVRYSLYFHKEVDGKYTHGDFEFIGENLDINRFYYQPLDITDALFPVKYSKTDAAKIADEFVKQTKFYSDYKRMDQNQMFMPYTNQTLTEPIRYDFNYQFMKNGIPVPDQGLHITVLGNGEITSFNGPYRFISNLKFEDTKAAKSKNDILKQFKENFDVELQYLVDYNFPNQENNVKLVYMPLPGIEGIHAITGDWKVQGQFVKELPAKKELKFLSDKPLPPKSNGITVAQAKALAEKLLNVDEYEEIKLRINDIQEMKNYRGKDVLYVNYMYETKNMGHGSSLEFDVATGELLQFHDSKSYMLEELGLTKKSDESISYDEALKKAVDYIKENAPSYMHHFAYPTIEAVASKEGYYLTFPAIKDGITISGFGLNVGVSKDGTINSMNVHFMDVTDWPSAKDVIAKEKIVEKFLQDADMELSYMSNYLEKDNSQYYLTYTPKYKDQGFFHFMDALTGEWSSYYGANEEQNNMPVVKNHWAEEELNFMINAGILKVKDIEAFNPDAATNKGDAIDALMKSLTRFYDHYYPGNEEERAQSFENIPPSHPLYQVVERAVSLGIVDKTQKEFPIDEKLTREELAVWYIKALGLEKAAKHSSIFNINFSDKEKVKAQNKGYVALANELGILTADKTSQFYPEQEVTLAQLSVSIFRMARHAASDNRFYRY